ncbi:MAG: DNA cytosine methyltransferase, partial [Bacteroidia bacterium]
MNSETTFPLISRFSGWGGGDLGAKQAGFTTVFAADFDKNSVVNHRLNFPETPIYQEDVTNITPSQTLELSGLSFSDYYGYLGTPSCQGISIAGKFNPYNPLNTLMLGEPFFIAHLKPAFFMIENVASLNRGKMNILKSLFVEQIENWLGDYEVREGVLNANDYGVPQSRKRYILIGFRKDLEIIPEFPIPNVYKPSIEDALPYVDGIAFGYGGKNFRPYYKPCPTLTKTENLWKVFGSRKYQLQEEEIL